MEGNSYVQSNKRTSMESYEVSIPEETKDSLNHASTVTHQITFFLTSLLGHLMTKKG